MFVVLGCCWFLHTMSLTALAIWQQDIKSSAAAASTRSDGSDIHQPANTDQHTHTLAWRTVARVFFLGASPQTPMARAARSVLNCVHYLHAGSVYDIHVMRVITFHPPPTLFVSPLNAHHKPPASIQNSTHRVILWACVPNIDCQKLCRILFFLLPVHALANNIYGWSSPTSDSFPYAN